MTNPDTKKTGRNQNSHIPIHDCLILPIESFEIKGAVTNIEYQAFLGCSSLTTINLPTSLISIKEGAFQDCKKLKSIELPNSLKSIDNHAFDGCRSLLSIILNEGITTLGVSSFSNCISLESVTLPASLDTIPNSCFYGDTSLKNINIPSSINLIGLDAFFGCYNVSFDLSESIDYIASTSSNFNEIIEIDDFKNYALKHYYIKKVEVGTSENS